MDVKFHIGVYCTCGWALEGVRESVEHLGSVTVKPCPICTGKAKWANDENEGKFNRRGVMVDERST